MIAGMIILFVGVFIVSVALSSHPTGSPPDSPSATQTAAPVPSATQPLPVQQRPPQGLTKGTYEVGVDIKAGTYRTSGPDQADAYPYCYWARSRDASGDMNSITANGSTEGPSIVKVNKGEFFTVHGSCNWILQGG
jgi:hypothetical protein